MKDIHRSVLMPKKDQINQNRNLRKSLNTRSTSPYSVALNKLISDNRVTRSKFQNHYLKKDFVPVLDSTPPLSAARLLFNSPALEETIEPESSPTSNIISIEDTSSVISSSSNIESVPVSSSNSDQDKNSTVISDVNSTNLLELDFSEISPILKQIVDSSTKKIEKALNIDIHSTRIERDISTKILGNEDTTEPFVEPIVPEAHVIAPVVQDFISSFLTNSSSSANSTPEFHSIIATPANPLYQKDIEKDQTVQDLISNFEKNKLDKPAVVIAPSKLAVPVNKHSHKFENLNFEIINNDYSRVIKHIEDKSSSFINQAKISDNFSRNITELDIVNSNIALNSFFNNIVSLKAILHSNKKPLNKINFILGKLERIQIKQKQVLEYLSSKKLDITMAKQFKFCGKDYAIVNENYDSLIKEANNRVEKYSKVQQKSHLFFDMPFDKMKLFDTEVTEVLASFQACLKDLNRENVDLKEFRTCFDNICAIGQTFKARFALVEAQRKKDVENVIQGLPPMAVPAQIQVHPEPLVAFVAQNDPPVIHAVDPLVQYLRDQKIAQNLGAVPKNAPPVVQQPAAQPVAPQPLIAPVAQPAAQPVIPPVVQPAVVPVVAQALPPVAAPVVPPVVQPPIVPPVVQPPVAPPAVPIVPQPLGNPPMANNPPDVAQLLQQVLLNNQQMMLHFNQNFNVLFQEMEMVKNAAALNATDQEDPNLGAGQAQAPPQSPPNQPNVDPNVFDNDFDDDSYTSEPPRFQSRYQSRSQSRGGGQNFSSPRNFSGYTKRPPKLDIKKFTGKKEDFLTFRVAFKDAHENTGLDNISLAIRLGQHLEGEASKRFGYIASNPTDDSYRALWCSLENTYGSSQEQAQEKLEKFVSMPAIKNFNATTVAFLCTTFEEHWNLLKKALGSEFYSPENFIYKGYIKKFPSTEIHRYRDYLDSNNSDEGFPTLKAWLFKQWKTSKLIAEKGSLDKSLQFWQQEKLPSQKSDSESKEIACYSRETSYMHTEPLLVDTTFDPDTDKYDCFVDLNDCYRKHGDDYVPIDTIMFRNRVPDKRGNNHNVTKQPTLTNTITKTFMPNKNSVKFVPGKQLLKCHKCNVNDHAIWNCRDFANLGQVDKMKLAKEKGLCLRCLNTGHYARDCKVRFVCDIAKCGQKHHRLLHPYKMTKQTVLMFHEQGIDSDVSDTEECSQ